MSYSGETRVCKREDCTLSGQEQPIENFPLNGDGKDGRRWQCKSCMRKINQAWRTRHRDHVKKYNKDRRPKNDTEVKTSDDT